VNVTRRSNGSGPCEYDRPSTWIWAPDDFDPRDEA